MLRRIPAATAVAIVCLAALSVACYRNVLFRGETFGFRDASQYYYPLHQRIQQEWDAGRLPLWLPEENAGAPLLANPTAAVLYPGKIVFAVLPYAWAARLYGILHTLLAFGAMIVFGRGIGLGGIASTLAALAYAFGAPVLSLHSNVIFLVGAAWFPLGLWAIDSLLRVGRRGSVAALALTLAMMVLGGDPEAAYLCVVAGGVYGVVVSVFGRIRWRDGEGSPDEADEREASGRATSLTRPLRGHPLPGGEGPETIPLGTLGRRLGKMALTAVLGVMLAGVQVMPTVELVRLSARVTGAMGDPYRYSTEPVRLIELAWPNVTGRVLPENRSWLVAVQKNGAQQFWVPSLYLGGLTLALALAGATLVGGPPARRWLTALAVLALLASLGPLGGVYPAMVAALPGFGAFRYPSKLLPLASLAICGLAGFGWERLCAGAWRRGFTIAVVLGSLSLATLGAIGMRHDELLKMLVEAPHASSLAGPLDTEGSIADATRGLLHGALVCAAAAVLAMAAPRWPQRAGVAACAILTIDLAIANAGLVWTVPQAVLDEEPEMAQRIREAERQRPSASPFRVFRLPSAWYPRRFHETRSPSRLSELVVWERDTLQPSHALGTGLAITLSPGVMDLSEYLFFFRPMPVPADAGISAALGVPPGKPVVYYPRRSVNVWGSRYMIVPAQPDWSSMERGYAAFLEDAEPLAPVAGWFAGPGGEALRDAWQESQDWQLLRNESVYPRAWVVHDARVISPVQPGDDAALRRTMQRLLYRDDAIWHQPASSVIDTRASALIETDQPRALAGYLPRTPPSEAEAVAVVHDEPLRVELAATLERPGLVVLADTYYPGWMVEVDGTPAPILRVNRMMRGVAVKAGEHRIVFRYRPASVWLGAALSACGLLTLVVMLALGGWRTRHGDR